MDKWWKSLLWATGSLAAGIFVFAYLDGKERAGESFRMQWIFVLLYDLLGKWGVLGVFLAIAAGFVVRSVFQRRRQVAAATAQPAAPVAPPSTPGTRPFDPSGPMSRDDPR